MLPIQRHPFMPLAGHGTVGDWPSATVGLRILRPTNPGKARARRIAPDHSNPFFVRKQSPGMLGGRSLLLGAERDMSQ